MLHLCVALEPVRHATKLVEGDGARGLAFRHAKTPRRLSLGCSFGFCADLGLGCRCGPQASMYLPMWSALIQQIQRKAGDLPVPYELREQFTETVVASDLTPLVKRLRALRGQTRVGSTW